MNTSDFCVNLAVLSRIQESTMPPVPATIHNFWETWQLSPVVISMHICRVQLNDALIVKNSQLVLAQLGQAVASVVIQPHCARALLQGCTIILCCCSKVAKLAVGIASVAQSSQVCWTLLQNPAPLTILTTGTGPVTSCMLCGSNTSGLSSGCTNPGALNSESSLNIQMLGMAGLTCLPARQPCTVHTTHQF